MKYKIYKIVDANTVEDTGVEYDDTQVRGIKHYSHLLVPPKAMHLEVPTTVNAADVSAVKVPESGTPGESDRVIEHWELQEVAEKKASREAAEADEAADDLVRSDRMIRLQGIRDNGVGSVTSVAALKAIVKDLVDQLT